MANVGEVNENDFRSPREKVFPVIGPENQGIGAIVWDQGKVIISIACQNILQAQADLAEKMR